MTSPCAGTTVVNDDDGGGGGGGGGDGDICANADDSASTSSHTSSDATSSCASCVGDGYVGLPIAVHAAIGFACSTSMRAILTCVGVVDVLPRLKSTDTLHGAIRFFPNVGG